MDAPRIAPANPTKATSSTSRPGAERQSEVLSMHWGPNQYSAFTVRLSDRFGDHGLIAVVIGNKRGDEFLIDTWLMSCRVLKRQVEEEVLNEIVRLAHDRACVRIVGRYIPSAKNGMVQDLYPRLGFLCSSEEPGLGSGFINWMSLNIVLFLPKSMLEPGYLCDSLGSIH